METSTPEKFQPVVRTLFEAPATTRNHLDLQCDVDALRKAISQRTLPFWFDQCYDRSKAGYTLGYVAGTGAKPDDFQMLVSQARLIWTFSKAHLRGYSNETRDYLAAATHGYERVLGDFKDRVFGGFYWSIDQNNTIDSRKILYAHSFLIYALLEYAHAADSRQALKDAVELFEWIDSDRVRRQAAHPADLSARDPSNDAETVADIGGVAVKGFRSANTALHWMEALTDLYAETQLPGVKAALETSLQDNRSLFYPKDIRNTVSFTRLEPATRPGVDPDSHNTSYGHNVEFGWLMLRAQRVLGITLEVDHHQAMIDHALQFGFDHQRGGLLNSGPIEKNATDRGKMWWPQAELIAALCYLFASGQTEERYRVAMRQQLHWYFKVQMDPQTANPLWELTESGTPKDARISCAWQAAYHDLRGRWILIDLLDGALRV